MPNRSRTTNGLSPLAALCAVVAGVFIAGGLTGCKVPLTDIFARFVIADAAWFAEEETLFLFYEVEAEQGISEDSLVEIRFVTDDGVVDWVELSTLEAVHTHVPVDCGPNTVCGSRSLHIPLEPREVQLRLRYHREGELTLDPQTNYNVIGPGPAHTNRSLLVYGVFTEENRGVQWRARHLFPTLRNMEVERLGLRRLFTVSNISRGGPAPFVLGNRYLYGAQCDDPVRLGWQEVETEDRAIFSPEELGEEAFEHETVCARATVYDPTGPFAASAFARKNPEVRPAFPLLRSPIEEAVPIKYMLTPCNRTISQVHYDMQEQRLLMQGISPYCIDLWESDDEDVVAAAVADFVARVNADVEAVRGGGQDMILVMALHHDDDPAMAATLEQALAGILLPERQRSTPRVAGGFVLDSYSYSLTDLTVGATTLWCPSGIDFDEDDLEDGTVVPPAGLSSLICALPDVTLNFSLGPFDLGAVPILPNRQAYLNFIDIYSPDQAGEMRDLTFLAPQVPPNAEGLDLPPFGSVTFFDDEIISAEADDSFSYCETPEETSTAFFRSSVLPIFLPIASLPEWHAIFRETTYGLGLGWEFPYLLELEYEAVAALAVSAFTLSLPLGLGVTVEQDYGSQVWKTGEFPLAETLTQCTRFCAHPTFDGAGIYQVADQFDLTYRNQCYAPVFPERGDDGFPHDP